MKTGDHIEIFTDVEHTLNTGTIKEMIEKVKNDANKYVGDLEANIISAKTTIQVVGESTVVVALTILTRAWGNNDF